MNDYYFQDGSFVIENYNQKKTFANFLPGVAGKKGIPLWAFYVNRNQGINGFGLQDKNHPVMLFQSANKAYESVAYDGFRTFIKVDGDIYEAFHMQNNYPHKMIIKPHAFSIEETNTDLQIQVNVTYFGLPNENLAALSRKVELTNLGDKRKIEVLDGLAEILPAGVKSADYKAVSNLLQSWMDVDSLEDGFAFYKLRGSTNDTAEVSEVKDGNFYIGFDEAGLIRPITDQSIIFEHDTSKGYAFGLKNHDLASLRKKKQVNVNKVPCGFLPYEEDLDQHQSMTLYALSGHTHSLEFLEGLLPKITKVDYIEEKMQEASTILEELLTDVETTTAFPAFDAYIKQNYMDNFLRGGYPEPIGDQIYHLYARRHGDLERDYNFFSLAPEYYSSGSGNFRDVCQNRRLDSFIHPYVGLFNIKQFASLLQLDGYNPLSVNGVSYFLEDYKALADKHFVNSKSLLKDFFKNRFTPGSLVNFVEQQEIEVLTSEEAYLEEFINASVPQIEAAFGEGYWVDHFTYVLDLIESYQAIYPDKMDKLLFEEKDFLYFDSPVSIKKQHEKAVLLENGDVRQYDSLVHFDQEKVDLLKMQPHGTNYAHQGKNLYKTNLFTKLFILVLNKYSLLDPDGFGIEMEGGKPGWNDAMNGLPGLFGSGVSETIELKRIIGFLRSIDLKEDLLLPKEIYDFYQMLIKNNGYTARVHAREQYRDAIRFGLKEEQVHITSKEVKEELAQMDYYLESQLDKLFKLSSGVMPTFLTYEVTSYDIVKKDIAKGRTFVRPTAFKRRALPNFLEAPSRLMKIGFDQGKLKEMAKKIKESQMFDKTLLQYKTSESLEQESHEIGRARAFTAGWLERESNFLHMTYKYLLGLLKAGLYEEYQEAIESNLVCFMDPSVYGRSTLENSSFLAPSNNPNEAIHGQGFFARLSGSTVEAMNMWTLMMTGGKPFSTEDGTLVFQLKPALDSSFFTEDGLVSFTFLGKTKVTYVNPRRVSTYDAEVEKIELISHDGTTIVNEPRVKGSLAKEIRNLGFEEIKIYIK